MSSSMKMQQYELCLRRLLEIVGGEKWFSGENISDPETELGAMRDFSKHVEDTKNEFIKNLGPEAGNLYQLTLDPNWDREVFLKVFNVLTDVAYNSGWKWDFLKEDKYKKAPDSLKGLQVEEYYESLRAFILSFYEKNQQTLESFRNFRKELIDIIDRDDPYAMLGRLTTSPSSEEPAAPTTKSPDTLRTRSSKHSTKTATPTISPPNNRLLTNPPDGAPGAAPETMRSVYLESNNVRRWQKLAGIIR